MLLPLTIAVGIIAAIVFTVYAFRYSIAKFAGKAHRQIQEDSLEIRREYRHGFGRDKD